jgi:hypothetical protein
MNHHLRDDPHFVACSRPISSWRQSNDDDDDDVKFMANMNNDDGSKNTAKK